MFHYRRRVQFAETDLAGIVHFTWMFRYMEEAEHALWRAAGLSVAAPDRGLGWPRASASFDFKSPLRFEEECDVSVRLAEARRRSLRYEHAIARGGTLIGTGTMVSVCVRQAPDGRLEPVEVPADIVERLRAALSRQSG